MDLGWVVFAVVLTLMLALDLGVFHRHAHVIRIKEALGWSVLWVAVALAFNVFTYFIYGRDPALQFLTGYVVEKSLSIDNLFVFLVIFSYFGVPRQYQHRVLFWGIIGALISRAILIALGITLINRFFWMTYVLGAFLIVTGIKTAVEPEEKLQPEKNPLIRFLRRVLPVVDRYDEGRFFTRHEGRLAATPLLIVLVVIEVTDIVFALDSIPAILAITVDPFVVYTSNLFAILGLRSLFFALAGMMRLFQYLQYGVSGVLVLTGAKMLVGGFVHISEGVLLLLIALILGASVAASVWEIRRSKAAADD